MVKWILGLGLVVLLLIGGGVYYVYSNLGMFVEQAIETLGSEAVGVPVRVDGVELDLAEGRATIKGLTVANPPGYSTPNVFALGLITVDIDLDSLQEQNPIILDEIRIDAPEVYYEMNSAGKANVDVIRENVSSGEAEGEAVTPDPDAEPAEEGPPLLLRVRKLRFSEGKIDARTTALGGQQIDATLGTAELTNVGGNSGAPPADIGMAVVTELGRQTANAMGRGQIDSIIDDKIGGEEGKAIKGLLNRFGR